MVERFDDILKKFADGIPQVAGGGETPTPVSLEERLRNLIRDAKDAKVFTVGKADAFNKAIKESVTRPQVIISKGAGRGGKQEIRWHFNDGKCEVSSPLFPKSIWIVQDHHAINPMANLHEFSATEFLSIMKIAYKFEGKVVFFQ